MIKGTSDFLDQIVKTHRCPEHGPKLVVAWHAGENSYVIRCGEGHFPEEVTREMTPIEEQKAGIRPAHRLMLELLPKTDLATGAVLSPELVQGLIKYADKYGLDPYRGHVVLMYGKPYITLDGYLYHANKSRVDYRLGSRPLTQDERTTYIIGEKDHAWICQLTMDDEKRCFTGLGIVTLEEMEARSKKDTTKLSSPVVAAHPWQLAQKRAEWQAHRRAFPIGETEETKEE